MDLVYFKNLGIHESHHLLNTCIYFSSKHSTKYKKGFLICLYLICSVQVICHSNIYLTGKGIMHEAGYVDPIWST